MPEKLVVCLRFRASAGAERKLSGGARELAKRAQALGARIVAWHAGGLAVEFAPDAVEDAVELVTSDEMVKGVSVGIAQGELEAVIDGGSRVTLSTGEALERATALARVARTAEVLLHPELDAVKAGDLLSEGSRIGISGRERVRGLRLDRRHPWRGLLAEALRPLAAVPRRVGTALEALEPKGSALLAVRAGQGAGGTRALDEIAERAAAARTLRVGASAVGEPLGALRRAFVRARAMDGSADLGRGRAQSLESLLAGEGLEVDESAALIADFVGREGIALVDDAGDVDADTLEALAEACSRSRIRLVARLGPSEPLPLELGELELGGEIVVATLSAAESGELAQALAGGSLSEGAAMRFGRRGGASPLAVRAALRDALESGELIWDGARIVPRVRASGRGRAMPAEHWLKRRLRRVEPRCRVLLDALSVLGGEAELGELTELIALAHERVSLDAPLAALEASLWIHRTGDALVTLPSRTHQRVLVGALATEQLLELHRAVATALEAGERPLASASAALHALLGGRGGDAERLSRRSAASARASGLVASADALEGFARTLEQSALSARRLTGGFSWEAPVESRRLGALAEINPASEDAVSGRAALALREGDLEAIDGIVEGLRSDPEHALLADHLDAMARLARGETGDGLRLLRGAKERAQKGDPADRCRAALALGMGLAAAGRDTEALLEALEALSRARESDDLRGERACALFLAQLSRGAGDERAGELWDGVSGA